MLIFFALLYLAIGAFLAFLKNGKYVLPYIIFLNVYSAWVTDFIYPLEEGDQNVFDGISKYYTYFCFMSHFLLNRKKVKDYSLLYAFLFTTIYFIFIYTLRGIGPVVGLKFAVSTYGSVLLFFVLLFLLPTKKQVRNLVKFNLIMQLIIGVFQFLGLLHFKMNIGETFVGTNFLTGSFTRNNFYSEVISLLLLLHCAFDYRDYGELKILSKVFIFLVLGVVLETGVRTALMADVVVLVWLFIAYNKHKKYFKRWLLVGICFLGILLFSIYQTANQDVIINDRDAGTGLERQLNGIREISDSDNMEMSTVSLTFVLWQYFTTNPVIGPGLFYASPYGYGGIIAEDTANSTDATILFYMCETGLIGVICFIMIFRIALKRYNERKGAYMVFLYIFLISITDPGFMGFPYVIYLYIMLFYDNRDSYIESNKILSRNLISPNIK